MIPSRPALALLAALLIFGFPAVASATTYTVNSTGDTEAGPSFNCGALETCTLRAAIELSNASTGVDDEIAFGESVFDGEKADSTITVGFALPAIEDKLTIDGGRCETDANVEGPCVAVKNYGLVVRADEVTIEGLAITDAQVAISVEKEKFKASGNWIGFQLDGVDGP